MLHNSNVKLFFNICQEAEITEGNYIHAQAGDVIGIHYPDTATGAEHAVVYVETSTSTSTITTELSDVITTNSQDPCLPPGTITSSVSISNTQRVPALSVYIEGRVQRLYLYLLLGKLVVSYSIQ